MRTAQHLPLPMERYGLDTQGRNLFRVVWSDSRTYLVGGEWAEGFEFREVPMYPGQHSWILEKHLTAEEFAGSKEAWDQKERGDTKLGPYPSEGEWEFCYEFPFEPTDSMISIWIRGNRATKELTPQQRMDGIMAPMLERKKRQHQRIDDIFDESMYGFRNGRTRLVGSGNIPIHSTRSKRKGEHKLSLSAQDLGMPMDDNSFFTGGRNGDSSNRPGSSA